MFYILTEEQNDIIKKGVEELEKINQKMFDDLKSTIVYVEVDWIYSMSEVSSVNSLK